MAVKDELAQVDENSLFRAVKEGAWPGRNMGMDSKLAIISLCIGNAIHFLSAATS
jgi:hypothetical protein